MNCALPPAYGEITEVIADASARVVLHAGFLRPDLADELYVQLLQELNWTQHQVRIFGRYLLAPRRSAWHGEPGARYCYSGVSHEPAPWTPALHSCLECLQHAIPGQQFNSVLANHYRDGQDSMGWHADDERELGSNPVIASISLGATRDFLLRSRHLPRRSLCVALTHGSLLLMSGATQHNWQHALPRRIRCQHARINLTFRHVTALAVPPIEG